MGVRPAERGDVDVTAQKGDELGDEFVQSVVTWRRTRRRGPMSKERGWSSGRWRA